MIHRAILGSFEIFIAILLEHTGGRLPFYLSPQHFCILTISNETLILDYVKIKLVEDDDIREKIKNAEKLKYKYIIIIG